MSDNIKPIIVVSECLLNDRQNDKNLQHIQNLVPFINFIPVCPEKNAGCILGAVQASIRDNVMVLIENDQDVTDKINENVRKIFDDLDAVDGFILKHGSPTCGISDVRIHSSLKKVNTYHLGSGLFGSRVRQKFNAFPVQDEQTLEDPETWDFFLTTVFTFARFRGARQTETVHSLIHFHRQHKYLLMALKEKHYRNCGRIVANKTVQSPKILFQNYAAELQLVFSQKPQRAAIVNSLEHIFGYFSKQLAPQEKRITLHLVERYRNGEIPLSSITDLLWRYVLQFNQPYLKQQVIFHPYPKSLRRNQWLV